MNIIIIGAGKVGQTIARYLSDENDNVTIIDNKVQVLEKINDELDVMCVKGNCTDLRVLSEAGINEADILIAVTNSDELNMLCCLAAKKLAAKYTVARVRTPHYDEDVTVLADAIGIDLIINPEKAAANEISKMLRYPSICSIDDFSRGQVNLVGFTISENSVLVDMRVCDIDYIKGLILFCGVERDDDFIIPNGEFKFKKEDKIYVIGEHKNIEGFLKRLGKYKKRVKNVMIIGGSRIGYYLAKSIDDVGIKLKNIKFNKENLVAVIVRNDKTIIPSGDDCLKINDRVVIVTKNPMILDINDIFDGGTVKDEL